MNTEIKYKKKNLADDYSTNRNFEQLFKKSKKNAKSNKNKLFDDILIKSSEEKKYILKNKYISGESIENTKIKIKNFLYCCLKMIGFENSQNKINKLSCHGVDIFFNLCIFSFKIFFIIIYYFVSIFNITLIFISKNYVKFFSDKSNNSLKSYNFIETMDSTNMTSSSKSIKFIKSYDSIKTNKSKKSEKSENLSKLNNDGEPKNFCISEISIISKNNNTLMDSNNSESLNKLSKIINSTNPTQLKFKNTNLSLKSLSHKSLSTSILSDKTSSIKKSKTYSKKTSKTHSKKTSKRQSKKTSKTQSKNQSNKSIKNGSTELIKKIKKHSKKNTSIKNRDNRNTSIKNRDNKNKINSKSTKNNRKYVTKKPNFDKDIIEIYNLL